MDAAIAANTVLGFGSEECIAVMRSHFRSRTARVYTAASEMRAGGVAFRTGLAHGLTDDRFIPSPFPRASAFLQDHLRFCGVICVHAAFLGRFHDAGRRYRL